MKHFVGIASIVAILCIQGCGQIYSPFLLLPPEPLKQDQVQIAGSWSALPSLGEVFPSTVNGATGLIRYGVTDRFSIEGEMWTDDVLHLRRTGYSLQSTSLLSDRSIDWRFGFIPRAVVVFNGYQPEGWGVSGSLAVWTPKFLGLNPYLGAGIGFGAADLNGNGDQYAFGYTFTENAGVSYEVSSHASLALEFAGLVIYDTHNQSLLWWGVPSLAAGYRF